MQVLFLDPLKPSPTSKREDELQVATARSHAARVAHRLKKRARTSPKQSSPPKGDFDEQYLPISPGFGSYRSEVKDLLPSQACLADLRALDFFLEVIMPGIDVANEMFDNTAAFHFALPNLVGCKESIKCDADFDRRHRFPIMPLWLKFILQLRFISYVL